MKVLSGWALKSYDRTNWVRNVIWGGRALREMFVILSLLFSSLFSSHLVVSGGGEGQVLLGFGQDNLGPLDLEGEVGDGSVWVM